MKEMGAVIVQEEGVSVVMPELQQEWDKKQTLIILIASARQHSDQLSKQQIRLFPAQHAQHQISRTSEVDCEKGGWVSETAWLQEYFFLRTVYGFGE